MCLAEDQRPVERFLPQGADHLLADRVRPGACGGLLSTRMPASANTASNASVNCPPRSLMMKLQAAGTFARVHQEVGGCLGGPVGLEYAIVAVTCFFSQQPGAVTRRSCAARKLDRVVDLLVSSARLER